jgi:hypothetical protein
LSWSKSPCSNPAIARVDQVHDELVADLARLKEARTPYQRNYVVSPFAEDKRKRAFTLARVAMEEREAAEQELPALRAHLRALSDRARAQRFAVVTDQLNAALKWVPEERMRCLNPVALGPAFFARLELPYIAYLAVAMAPFSEQSARVRTFVRLSLEAVELERKIWSRGLDEFPDGPRAKPEFVPAIAAFAVASGLWPHEEVYALTEVRGKYIESPGSGRPFGATGK